MLKFAQKETMMKKIREAIISLDIMPKETYDKFNKFSKLQNASADEIWKHYPSTGLNNYDPNTMVLEASIIETYLLINYLLYCQKTYIPPRLSYH